MIAKIKRINYTANTVLDKPLIAWNEIMVLWLFTYSFLITCSCHLLLSQPSAVALVSPVHSVRPLLVVRLKPSRRLGAALSFAHFTAIGLLWPLALPVMVKLMGSMLLAASLALYVRYFALLTSPGSVRGLELGLESSDQITCTLETQRGDRVACALLGSSFVTPYLTVLELKPLELRKLRQRFSHRSVVILPDGIDAEEFRQLRVLLRWKWKDPRVLN